MVLHVLLGVIRILQGYVMARMEGHITNSICELDMLAVVSPMDLFIKRSLKLGHVSTSTRPSATALPGSRVSGAL
jgi:hypothetical protein